MLDVSMTEHIDIKSTNKVIGELLKRYKYLMKILPERTMPKITQSFNSIPSSTVRGLNSVERSAHENIKREKLMAERKELQKLLHEIVEQLSDDEKYIITNKYLINDDTSDYDIYLDLSIGKTKYYQIKKDAFIKMAILLGLEVYK